MHSFEFENELVSALHQKALSAAKDFKNSEMALMQILESIDQHRGYRDLGYPSLTQYCIQALRLSEQVSQSLIAVMRKSIEVPALRESLAKDEITLSKARKLVSVIPTENCEEWLAKAREFTTRELEREVVGEAPETFDLERVKYVGGQRMEIRFILSQEEYWEMKKGLDLVSQKRQKQVGLRELLVEANGEFVAKHDPIEKWKRASKRRQSKIEEPITVHVNNKRGRSPILKSVRHEVIYRDDRRCTHADEHGVRCPNTRWLHLHHILPVAEGGANSVENLKLLCSGHHQMLHGTSDLAAES